MALRGIPSIAPASAIGRPTGRTYSQYMVTLGPVGYWPLGEANGDAIDAGSGANNGTVTIGTGARDAAALDDGGDGCVTFDGSATYIAMGQQAQYDVTNNFSVVFAIRIDGTPSGFYVPFSYGHDGSSGWVMQGNGANFDAVFQTAGSAAFGDLRDGNVHLCAATKSSGTGIKAFVDGVRVAHNSGATAAIAEYASRNLNIGRDPGTGRYFIGEIDEVAFFSRVLAESEVEQMYRMFLNRSNRNPLKAIAP